MHFTTSFDNKFDFLPSLRTARVYDDVASVFILKASARCGVKYRADDLLGSSPGIFVLKMIFHLMCNKYKHIGGHYYGVSSASHVATFVGAKGRECFLRHNSVHIHDKRRKSLTYQGSGRRTPKGVNTVTINAGRSTDDIASDGEVANF